MLYQHHLYRTLARDARRLGGLPRWLLFRCLPAALLGSLLVLLLSTVPAQSMAQDSGQPDLAHLESGHMLLRDAVTGHYEPALMHASKVHFAISGTIATVTLEQSFSNPGERWMEGVYAFPLPDGAAVRFLEMRVGERRIVGKIREKAAARKIYEQARQAGKKASLVEQQRPNLFRNRVANIGPGETVTVHLEYVQAVAITAGGFSLRFPMTITPRYMPGTPLRGVGEDSAPEALTLNPELGWALPTDQVPDATGISPFLHPAQGSDGAPLNPIEITASLDMGLPLANVSSPYHEIALARRAGVYDIRLAGGVSEMDRDFVLQWQPVAGSAPTAALFTERIDGQHYGLLMVLPPAAGRAGPAMAREIIFVVDTSGSMGGVSIEQARASVALALQQLRPRDKFNIIEFNSSHRALYREPVSASGHHVQRAQEFVRLLQASGGTEMLPALQAALTPPAEVDALREQSSLRQVIFITDGAVGNEAALLEEISTLLGDSRLFTVGIGSAPNSWFMRKAAQFGRGSHTHIGDLNEVGDRMAALFEQLSRPAAVNLSVQWPVTVEAWPRRIPDLYQGQPLSLAVKFGESPPSGEVVVSGELEGQVWRKRLLIEGGADPASAPAHEGVASLWARRKIESLLDQKVSGRDEAAVRADVLPVALRHHLLSPYTSFVAVEEVVSGPVGENQSTAALANTRPRGQSPQTFAYPRTATTGPAKVWFGGLALFVALLIRVLRQPELDHAPQARD